jgi:hypothetical protein
MSWTEATVASELRAADVRTRQQVNAALNGCEHTLISHLAAGVIGDFATWECSDCGQEFGPIFFETPRRNGDPTIKEAMTEPLEVRAARASGGR